MSEDEVRVLRDRVADLERIHAEALVVIDRTTDERTKAINQRDACRAGLDELMHGIGLVRAELVETERERDQAREDLRRVTIERDALRKVNAGASDTRILRTELTALHKECDRLRDERDTERIRQGAALKRLNAEHAAKIRNLTEQRDQARENARTEVDRIRQAERDAMQLVQVDVLRAADYRHVVVERDAAREDLWEAQAQVKSYAGELNRLSADRSAERVRLHAELMAVTNERDALRELNTRQVDEIGDLNAKIKNYENATTWLTNCTGCANLLDQLYDTEPAKDLLNWLVALDRFDSEERKTVTLSNIISRARTALRMFDHHRPGTLPEERT